MSTESSCNEERSFLKARESRQSTSKQSEHRIVRKTHELHEFWNGLHGKLAYWKERLDLVVADHRSPTSATQCQESQKAVEELSEEIVSLRRSCLSELDVMDFPPADVRLLHELLLKHSAFLDEAKEEMSPKSKFRFKRYRQRMQTRKYGKENSELPPKEIEPMTDESSLHKDQEDFGGTVVENTSDSTIIVEASGSVRILSADIPGCTEQNAGENSTTSLRPSSTSILLQNLVDCNVFLRGSYQAVQIRSVNGGRVEVSSVIGGACHVSSSSGLYLKAAAHQLRLHDSHNLSCFVHVASSPILEDCTHVSFHYDPCDETNAVSGAKDFNWLRNGIPSPNFSLVPIRGGRLDQSNSTRKTETDSSSDIGGYNVLCRKQTDSHGESDDDEL